MLSRIRNRVTYANVAATLALLFTMTGGAYAANRYLITSTKQISPKVLKALRGGSGAPGAAGTAGPQGPAGAVGAKGETGTAGTNGTNGQSVTSKAVTTKEAACEKLGGSEFVSASGKTLACNGREGSPWTAGGTLPKGKTEQGMWAYGISKEQAAGFASVSFVIPLEAAPAIHYINANGKEINGALEEVEPSPECAGGTAVAPKAKPGNLCVYTEAEEGGAPFFSFGTSVTASGAVLTFLQPEKHVVADARGSWAVTAE
jgi:hypothetical protein